jgi:hypothetical protein
MQNNAIDHDNIHPKVEDGIDFIVIFKDCYLQGKS